ncbi:MAG: flavin reductase [Ktedonobacterales bacterium]|nr:flavin reductase [Ktedonobacterales bacterium]
MTDTNPRATLAALWSPLLAVTTRDGERTNGQIIVAALSGSILPDVPRVIIELWKSNLTHDMVLASRIFALHVLDGTPGPAVDATLALVRTLGMHSGRDGDKLAGIDWRPGTNGCPILTGALSYLEATICATLDADEATIFLAEVTGGTRLRDGSPLTLPQFNAALPADWRAEYAASRGRQDAAARQARGLAPTA